MDFLFDFKKVFEKKLDSFITNSEINEDIKKSLKYSLMNGGKRLRPWIINRISELLDINDSLAIETLSFLVEITHTTSLIHDDMPEIDNSSLRRGKKTNHIVFGDYLSLLAGDYGFVLPLKIISELKIDSLKIKNRLFSHFSTSTLKLIEGETEDVLFEKLGKSPSKEEIINMYRKKTGELFGLCFSLPFILKDKTNNIDEIYSSGLKFGISFQIYDDLKDVFSTEEELGKNVNTDENKLTLLKLVGHEQAKKYADNLFEEIGTILKKNDLEDFYYDLIKIKSYIEKK
ncbi:MAG: polyprenyl synthetase family protein [Thermotogota bacterium]